MGDADLYLELSDIAGDLEIWIELVISIVACKKSIQYRKKINSYELAKLLFF